MRFLIAVFLAVLAYGEAKRIIGGSNASTGDFRHQLSLRDPTLHKCGAVLIALNRAITAAHCVPGSSYTIRAGTLAHATCGSNCQNRIVSSANRHIDFDDTPGSGYPNDIAVLNFDELSSNSEVGIIFLDSPDSGTLSDCQISGWGYTTVWGSTLAVTLQKASITTLTNIACKAFWGNYINNGHICVYGDGARGSCSGDSGGPLTCSKGGLDVVAGVTSWGRTGCSPSYPSVYTRVSYFRDWIDDN